MAIFHSHSLKQFSKATLLVGLCTSLLTGCGIGLRLPRIPVLTALTGDIDLSSTDANLYATRRLLRVGNQLWGAVGNLNSQTWISKLRSAKSGTIELESVEGFTNACCWGSNINIFDGILYSQWWEFGLGRLTVSNQTLTVLDTMLPSDPAVQVALGGYHRALDMDVYGTVLITTPLESPPAVNKVVFSDITNTAAPALLSVITDARFGNSDLVGRAHAKYLIIKSQDLSYLFSVDMSDPVNPIIMDAVSTDRDEIPRLFTPKGAVLKNDLVLISNWTAGTLQSFRVGTDGRLSALQRLTLPNGVHPSNISPIEGDYFIGIGSSPSLAFILKLDDQGRITKTSEVDLAGTSYGSDIHCLPDSAVCVVSGGEYFPHYGILPLRFERP